MASSDFTKQLKAIVYDLYNNGEPLEKPRGKFIRKELSEERLKLIKSFIDLLMNTKIIGAATREYIKDRYITIEGVAEKLNDMGHVATVDSVRSKIWNDKNRLVSYFGEDIILRIVEYTNYDIASYKKKVIEAFGKYANLSILNNIALKLPNVTSVETIDEYDYREFLNIITPYNKKHMQFIEANLSPQAVGYFRYLLGSNSLSGEDLRRKEEILCFFGDG